MPCWKGSFPDGVELGEQLVAPSVVEEGRLDAVPGQLHELVCRQVEGGGCLAVGLAEIATEVRRVVAVDHHLEAPFEQARQGMVRKIVDHAQRGRSGTTALRQAIDDWSLDAKPADSVLEPAMRRLVSRYGLPDVEFHARVGGREVDFRIIGTPIVIECDGWRYHGRDREQFERDRANDADFVAHGWIVLRFTYRRITSRPSEVARRIEETIARWVDARSPDAA